MFSIAGRPVVLGFAHLLVANRDCTGWMKDRVLKPARKLSLVVTFVSSESTRPDQIADLNKSCIFSIAVRHAVFGFVLLSAANREYTGWLNDRVLKPVQKLILYRERGRKFPISLYTTKYTLSWNKNASTMIRKKTRCCKTNTVIFFQTAPHTFG